MNLLEIDESINDIQRALGFKVQSVSFYNKTLVLRLWQNFVSYDLILSAQWGQQGAFLIPTPDVQRHPKNEKKPLLLFANTHFKDCLLIDIARDESIGRLLELEFSSGMAEPQTDSKKSDVTSGKANFEDSLKISLNLIPSALNISLTSGSKTVHLQKPKDIPVLNSVDLNALTSRGLEVLKNPWLKNRFGRNANVGEALIAKTNSSKTPPSGRKQEIAKKHKALIKVKKDLDNKSKSDFFDFASLMGSDPEAAKIKFPELYDSKVNPHKLKDIYFEKHKNLAAKKTRVLERIQILEQEIQSLEKQTDDQWLTRRDQKKSKTLNVKAEVKARKFEIAQDLVAYLGKSAQDNLKLLRSAKAWHMWCHVKDLPSAHMIIFKDKSRILTDSETQKALKWFVSEIKTNTKGLNHSALDILMAECRYVKPIKGDKLGRVNYANEKVIHLRED
jgi:hypothetical protein